MSALGHSLPMHSAPASNNGRCYPNSGHWTAATEWTLSAISGQPGCWGTPSIPHKNLKTHRSLALRESVRRCFFTATCSQREAEGSCTFPVSRLELPQWVSILNYRYTKLFQFMEINHVWFMLWRRFQSRARQGCGDACTADD